MLLDASRVQELDRLADARMEIPPLAQQQRVVGHLLRDGVLEAPHTLDVGLGALEEPRGLETAQRAGDIVTRLAQPHLYVPLTGPFASSQKVWPPGPLKEKNRRTGTWQMLLPKTEATCGVFGGNDLMSVSGWSGGRRDGGSRRARRGRPQRRDHHAGVRVPSPVHER